ncbi:MAG: glycosyl transferase [Bacteroidetes bacterium GWA2_30_7]|nr:MAG: glycosyl transferase [Bacteroidetes bacterium GWA2_30_7]
MNLNPVKLKDIYCYSFSSKIDLIQEAIVEKKILISINAETILNKDTKLQQIINNNIGHADGIGAVWALKIKGYKNTIKIPGVELWLDIISKFESKKSFYLIGSTDNVIQKTVEKLKQNFPHINIVNYRNGFISNDEDKQLLKNDIIEKKPDIIFIAMGSPKQEYFANELSMIHKAVYQCIGGSFDVYSGKRKRAPRLFIILGLEWLYRLINEPKRIKRQHIIFKFLFYLIIRKI